MELMNKLMMAKADVNAKVAERFGRTDIQAAAESGHLEVVEMLLTAKADVNAKATGCSGRTALQAAAESGHLEASVQPLSMKYPYISIKLYVICYRGCRNGAEGAGGGGLKSADCRPARGVANQHGRPRC